MTIDRDIRHRHEPRQLEQTPPPTSRRHVSQSIVFFYLPFPLRQRIRLPGQGI